MARHRKPTNDEMVKLLMNCSRNGALMHPFVLKAIEYYAQACIKAGPAEFDTPLSSGEAWIRCAQEALEKVTAHLAR